MAVKRKKEKVEEARPSGDGRNKILSVLLVLALLVILVLAFKLMEDKGTPSNQTATTKPSSITTGAAKEGDVVEVDYVGQYENGTVFDTSSRDVAESSGILNPAREYKPIVFTIGLGELVPGFEEGVIGMKVGDEKTVTIPPEKGYGLWSEDNTDTISRVQMTDKVENISQDIFENVTGEVAVAGKSITVGEIPWNMTILAVSNGTVSIMHNPENGTIVPTPMGNATLTSDEDTIYSTLQVTVGERVLTQFGYMKVLAVNDTSVTLDANHELAGKTIIFDLKLVSINQKTDPYAEQAAAALVQQ